MVQKVISKNVFNGRKCVTLKETHDQWMYTTTTDRRRRGSELFVSALEPHLVYDLAVVGYQTMNAGVPIEGNHVLPSRTRPYYQWFSDVLPLSRVNRACIVFAQMCCDV